jgi:hypothetical protein
MRHLMFIVTCFITLFGLNKVAFFYGMFGVKQFLIFYVLSIAASIAAWFLASVLDSAFTWRANKLSYAIAGFSSGLLTACVGWLVAGSALELLAIFAPTAAGVASLYFASRVGRRSGAPA